jgi:hypothetical protein
MEPLGKLEPGLRTTDTSSFEKNCSQILRPRLGDIVDYIPQSETNNLATEGRDCLTLISDLFK